MTILVSIRNVYGNDLVYPECDKAKVFAQIAGSKTLTDYSIKLIKKLGYSIQVRGGTL